MEFVSGADSAQWLALLAIVTDGGQPVMTPAGPDVRFCVVPRQAVTVRDTWQVTAMRGTGTNTVIADGVAVAADMAISPAAAPRIDRPLFRVPIINQLTSGGAAILIGMAQSAIDEVTGLAQDKAGPDGVLLADQPRVQAALGQAAARLGAARALVATTVGALDTAAAEGRQCGLPRDAETPDGRALWWRAHPASSVRRRDAGQDPVSVTVPWTSWVNSFPLIAAPICTSI